MYAFSRKDCGLIQLDSFELSNNQCMHEIGNSGQLRDDKADSSIIDLKTEISRAEDSYTDSIVATENVLDAFFSRKGCQSGAWLVGTKLRR